MTTTNKRSNIRFRFNSTKKFNNYFPYVILLVILLSLILFLSLKSSSPKPISNPKPTNLKTQLPEVPRLAYFITGSKGDGGRLNRLVRAVYHPRNYYLLHLDLDASDEERLNLAKNVKGMKNVMVVGKGNLVTSKGPTMIACLLHAVAILLKQGKDWNWFVNLGASDYPLMPQDG